MARYIIRRLLQFIPVTLIATFIVFALVFAIPGDPIRALAGDRPLAPHIVEAIRARYNLDDPLLVQYAKWLANVFQGDFGTTFQGRPVSDIIAQRFPVTLRLAIVAFIIQAVIGVLAGILAAVRQKGFVDSLVQVSTVVLVAIPTLAMAFIMQVVFGLQLGWFPIAGINQGWYSYLLPGAALASVSTAMVARLVRTSLIENLRADYVRTATAKGMKRSRVVGRHAMRNSLIPVVTFLGADLGSMLGGTIIIEGIFNMPGLGGEVFRAVRAQEGTVVVGIVTLFILFFVVINLIVDILYAYLDPRIRYE
ncbi:ABC transporter permease [Ornithinimicrobium pratense]|uniref:ABC transporter permease n=1 Tax=Ornithinimicrobium pratense TaxID=2593973 RepID=A0A5J6V3C0_9MICO|nr:ABC transporter permease [Ornithinimicrobium pratense]QFG68157.1 ABC transporter permease [Ornithinimicrobium pratense]